MKLRRIFNIISASFAIVTLLLSLSSCSDDSLNSNETDGDNEVRLFVKISTAVPSSREAGQGDQPIPIEQMHSCRLIMIDKSGKVEKNIYAKLDDPGDSHAFGNVDDVYNMIITTSGEKRFFLVANEESVGEDWYFEDSEGKVVTPTSGQTFTDWLSKNLETVEYPAAALNSIVFTLDYSRETGIPMSSFYEVELKPGKDTLVFYLVRVATKFQLNFENYRNEEVTFTSVEVNSIAERNYLIPHVGEKQQTIKDKYWIDWLKEAADNTTANPGLTGDKTSNDSINEQLGWLTDYYLPKNVRINSSKLNETDWSISGSTTQAGTPDPGKFSTGFFYLPESKSDDYFITFSISGLDEPMSKELHNVKSLFRDTYVIVNVRMYTGVEDIYVEIVNWKKQNWVHGTVSPY